MSTLKPIFGCFTKQLSIQGQTLQEIERRLGFYPGRLSQGALFFVAAKLPSIDDFELAGYTQVATHRTRQQHGKINDPQGPHENAAYIIQKHNAMREWSLHGSNRLVKVIALIQNEPQMDDDVKFPPGSGIPQWVVKKAHPIMCKEIARVMDYPGGRFIPDEGFTPVNYGR